MAHFGSGVEYSLHCLLYLVGLPENAAPPSGRDLAEFQGVPAPYIAKLFTRLEKARVVVSAEGVRGGFRLARPAEAISVLDVVDAIEGKKPLFECRDIRRNCVIFGEDPPKCATTGICGIHAAFVEAEARLRESLQEKSLADLAKEVNGKLPPDVISHTLHWFEQRGEQRSAIPGRRRKGVTGK